MTEADDVIVIVNMATLEVFQITGVSYKFNIGIQKGYVKHV
jgi:hypothetical protein